MFDGIQINPRPGWGAKNPLLPTSVATNPARWFKFFGQLIGVALNHGDPLGDRMVPSLCKQLLGEEPVLGDLEFVSPQIYQTLLRFKDHAVVEVREFKPEESEDTAKQSNMLVVVCEGPHGLDEKDDNGQLKILGADIFLENTNYDGQHRVLVQGLKPNEFVIPGKFKGSCAGRMFRTKREEIPYVLEAMVMPISRNAFVLETVQKYLAATGHSEREASQRIAKAFLGPDEIDPLENAPAEGEAAGGEGEEMPEREGEDDVSDGPFQQLMLRRAPSKGAQVQAVLRREISFMQPENIKVKEEANHAFKKAKHDRYLMWRRLNEAQLKHKQVSEKQEKGDGSLDKAAEELGQAEANFEESERALGVAEVALDNVMEEYAFESGEVAAVTGENINEWVEGVWKKSLIWNVQQYVEKVREGFLSSVEPRMLDGLTWQKLQSQIEGEKTIDVARWRAATKYEGYSDSSQTIQWFWEHVEELDNKGRSDLMKFYTGWKCMPKSTTSASYHGQKYDFKITKLNVSDDHHPVGHTCFLQLDLPAYKTKEKLKEKVEMAVAYSGTSFLII
eukprot:TRINITY_DN43929_c0_g1_i1.p1 TRINITY_DN43929_c0_g1~~TRINITY_DN43929_c0_g1_i1.p1  ORF type:complete len:562 (-),score=158.35 TRINITY_DN43929_c0_g1_i1:150-1835(-)